MGFMQILDRVRVRHGEDLHSGGFCAAQAGDGILDDQTGSWGDGLFRALSIQGVEGMAKRLWIRFSIGDVFGTSDVEKLFTKPGLFEDEFDLMAEGAGCNG